MDSAIDNGIRVNLRMRFTCTVYRAVAPKSGKKGGARKAIKKAETGEILMKNLGKGGWEALEGGMCTTAGSGSAAGGTKDREIMCFTTRPVESFEVLNDLVVDRGPSPYVSLLELFGEFFQSCPFLLGEGRGIFVLILVLLFYRGRAPYDNCTSGWSYGIDTYGIDGVFGELK